VTKHVQDRRGRILSFIHRYSMENGYSPTVREMAEASGLASTSTVHFHLQEAVRDGELRYLPGRSRTWMVTPKGDHSVSGTR
jgi:repressor LexA